MQTDCYPVSPVMYGSSCQNHDMVLPPYCATRDGAGISVRQL